MKIFRVAIAVLIFFGCTGQEADMPSKGLPDGPVELKMLLEGNPGASTKLDIYWKLYKAYRDTDQAQACTTWTSKRNWPGRLVTNAILAWPGLAKGIY